MVNVVVTHAALEPLSVTIQEAQRLTGESRSSVYNHIASGEYEARKSGTRLLILYDSIKRRIEGLPRAEVKPSRPRKLGARRRGRPPSNMKTTPGGCAVRRGRLIAVSTATVEGVEQCLPYSKNASPLKSANGNARLSLATFFAM